jgi:RNA-splicing ligase RtcB
MNYKINKVDFSQVQDLDIGENIIESLTNISKLDYVESISISRDIHYCNDIPVGTKVIATRFNAKWIGADIGCGVSTTKLPKGTIDKLDINYLQNELNKGDYHSFNLGTIGGGNHFVEFGYDGNQDEYVTIHTGSRSHGGMISEIIQEFDLDDNLKYKLYEKSLDFAKLNHKMLLRKIDPNIKLQNVYHHNYMERTDTKFTHYKGSLNGRQGKHLYPIPANMKDGVFLCVPLEDNLHIPHGAGRSLRRRDALDSLTQIDIDNQTSHLRNDVLYKNRDELPSTYKNIGLVLNPLVENDKIKIIKVIKPVLNFKG